MKIELSESEVKAIVLAHINSLVVNQNEAFNSVEIDSYSYSGIKKVVVSYIAPEITNVS